MIIKVTEITGEYRIMTRYGLISLVPPDWITEPVKGPICGCTDPLADNYDITANDECVPSTCTYSAKEYV